MANESELRKQMEATYPVSQWSRTTAADGKWLNKNTIKPLIDRDNFLADQIDGFDAKIQAEAVARAAADTAIEQSFANEATEREAMDETLDARIDDYADDLEAHKQLDASSDEFGHLTNTAYKKFNDAANAVEDNKDNWDNISTIKVGTDEVTGNTVTITGNKNINVTADTSTKTITIQTTGTVGSSNNPIYMKEDGTFEACTGGSTNKFGNAVISLNQQDAAAISYVNNSTSPINDSELDCQELYEYTGKYGRATPCTVRSSTILNNCIANGVNNFIVRFDGLAIQSEPTSTSSGFIDPSENICDLSIDVEDLEKYKMYTLNLVPLSLDALTNTNNYVTSLPRYSGRMQISLTFNADENKYIDFSDANYSCKTYGYLYNVPAFGINKRDGYECYYDDDSDFQYVIPYFSDNADVNNERWQISLNDTSEYDYDRSNVYTDISLKTIQPHSELSLFTSDTITTCSIELDGGTFKKLGSNKISAILMEFAGQFDESGSNNKDRLVVYRRQLSFMRGQDITVPSTVISDFSKTPYNQVIAYNLKFKLDSTSKKVTIPNYNPSYATYNSNATNNCYKKLNNTTSNNLNELKESVKTIIRKTYNKNSTDMPDACFTFDDDDTDNNAFTVTYKLSTTATVIYSLTSTLNISSGFAQYYYFENAAGKLVAETSYADRVYSLKDPPLFIKNFNDKINNGNYTEADLNTLAEDFKTQLASQIPQIKDNPDSLLVSFFKCSSPAQQQTGNAYKLQWQYTLPEYHGYTLYFFTEATY